MNYVTEKSLQGIVASTSVTPSDVDEIQATAGLFIGNGGNVAVEYLNGMQDTWVDLPAYFTLRVVVKKVLATGTTASNIKALY
jgi:hypothetical protein